MLNNRQEVIFSNLSDADQKAQNARNKLLEAQEQFENAKRKAQEIQNQGIITIQKDRAYFQTQTEEIIQRLKTVKQDTLLFQQQKTLRLLSKQVIESSLIQVQKKLKNCVDLKFQTSMNNFYISLLRSY